jgi:hypothetical protein
VILPSKINPLGLKLEDAEGFRMYRSTIANLSARGHSLNINRRASVIQDQPKTNEPVLGEQALLNVNTVFTTCFAVEMKQGCIAFVESTALEVTGCTDSVDKCELVSVSGHFYMYRRGYCHPKKASLCKESCFLEIPLGRMLTIRLGLLKV